ncbi:efflux RND transporter permease subunit, partial [Acinetobacter baumannii]
RHRFIMLLVALATIVVTAMLFQAIPKGFFPDEDTGLLTATTEASEDISSPAMVVLQKQVASIVQDNANVDFVVSSVGISNTGNTGRLFI